MNRQIIIGLVVMAASFIVRMPLSMIQFFCGAAVLWVGVTKLTRKADSDVSARKEWRVRKYDEPTE